MFRYFSLFLLLGLSSQITFGQQAACPINRLAIASVSVSAPKVEAFNYGLTKAFKLEGSRLGRRGKRKAVGVPAQPNLRVMKPQFFPIPPNPIKAPSFPVTGRWTGTVTQGSTVLNCTMDINADPGLDGPFSNAYPVNGGSTYSTQDGTEISQCDFVGAFWKNEFRYGESAQTKPFTMNEDGLKQGDLWLSSDGTHLAGKWITRGGQSGTVQLEKVSTAQRVFFYIAYVNPKKVPDNAFLRAAQTWEQGIKKRYSFDANKDTFLEKQALTVSDVITDWNDIANSSNHSSVVVGAIFSHASLPASLHPPYLILDTGLEFAGEPGAETGSTLSRELIDALPKLNWDRSGRFRLFGCNTAVERWGWSPAEEFAKTQAILTLGEEGYADFSARRKIYIEINDSTSTLYLGAYAVGRNTILYPQYTKGQRMPPKQFQP